jgi:hypothetical protein
LTSAAGGAGAGAGCGGATTSGTGCGTLLDGTLLDRTLLDAIAGSPGVARRGSTGAATGAASDRE